MVLKLKEGDARLCQPPRNAGPCNVGVVGRGTERTEGDEGFPTVYFK